MSEPTRRSDRLDRRQVRRYFGVARWLLADSLWRFKLSAAMAIVGGALAVTAQAGVIGLIIRYAQALEHDQSFDLLGRSLGARSSMELLGLVAVGGFAALVAAAGLDYLSQAYILRLTRNYQAFCGRRVLRLIHDTVGPWRPTPINPDPEGRIRRLINTDARYLGRVLMILLGGFAGLWMVLAGLALLAAIDWLLTLGIIVLLGVSIACYYVVSVRGAAHSRKMEEHAAEASRDIKDIMSQSKLGKPRQRSLGSTAPGPLDSPASSRDAAPGCVKDPQPHAWEQAVFERGSMSHYLDAYEGRLRAMANSRLVSGLLLAVVLAVILAALGGRTIERGQGWSLVLAYLVALQYTLAGVNQVTRRMTSINRFYPHLKRYAAFIVSAQAEADDPGPVAPRQAARIRVRPATALPQSEPAWRAVDGAAAPIAVVSPLPVDRVLAASLLGAMYRHTDPSPSIGTINFSAPGPVDNPADDDDSPDAATWGLIDAADLTGLDPAAQSSLKRMNLQSILLRHDPRRMDKVGGWGERTVLVHDGIAVIGVGSPDWLSRHADQVARRLEPAADRRRGAASADDVDDLDEG